MRAGRTIVVTGAAGFIGRHAAEALKKRGWTVYGSSRALADLGDPEAARRLLEKTRPSAVLHAAGTTRAADWKGFWDAHVTPTVNVLEAAARLPRPPRIVVVGSASEYGDAQGAGPAREDGPCNPVSPYGASKLAQTLAALSYGHQGLEVVVARVFNASGPDSPAHLVPGTFARQLAAGASTLVTGDLSSFRDFVDVRDIGRALASLAEPRVAPGIYNVCSGEAVKIRAIVDTLIRLSKRRVELQLDKKRGGAALPRFVGDPRRMRKLGWRPEIHLEESLAAALGAS